MGGWFEPWRLKSTTMIIIVVWIVYIFRLIWTFFKISSSDFILFVDREFTYLFTWSWITIYLFRLNSWTFGGVGVFIRHWSINICFYSHRCPNLWIANIFFLKEWINCFSFAHNSFSFKNMTQKLTWKKL